MSLFKAHYNLEKHSVGFVVAIILAASVGGMVEILPLFTIDETVETLPDMRVYTPLELAGRNIYIREGCYNCHSQMIRTLRDEVERECLVAGRHEVVDQADGEPPRLDPDLLLAELEDHVVAAVLASAAGLALAHVRAGEVLELERDVLRHVAGPGAFP